MRNSNDAHAVAGVFALLMFAIPAAAYFGQPSARRKPPQRCVVVPFDSYGEILAERGDEVLVRVETWVAKEDVTDVGR